MINIGCIYGGSSTEHEISIISAVQAMNNLNKDKYNIIPIYLSKDNKFYYSDNLIDMDIYKNLNKIKNISKEVILTKKDNNVVLLKKSFPYSVIKTIDFILPVLHGYGMEDGTISSFLDLLDIPYAESDLYSSSIGQDKVSQKMILKYEDIPVTDFIYFYENEYNDNEDKIIKDSSKLGFPLIVKPSRQGSSVGIKIANNKEELKDAIEEAINYDEKILVEKVVSNLTELNISVIGDNSNYEVSDIEKVFKSDEILSFENKYMDNSKSKGMASLKREIPAKISKDIKSKIEKYAIKASRSLNINGVIRIDFLLDDKTNDIYLNEINIIPGSLSFYLWTSKMSYSELLDKLINLGIKRYKEKSKKSFSFTSNVLENFNGTKGVKK